MVASWVAPSWEGASSEASWATSLPVMAASCAAASLAISWVASSSKGMVKPSWVAASLEISSMG